MTLSLDHIFVITEPGAATADRLLDIGLTEGNANVHPGQGTSNRRFFLDGFTIELLYVSDAEEAANGAGKGLGILARSHDNEANPFGLVVRVENDETIPVFPNWKYVPDYFDGKMCFYVGNNSGQLTEPLCICMPPALPKRTVVAAEFANKGWQLTKLELDVPVGKPSTVLKHFSEIDRVQIELDRPHKMSLEFNDGKAGNSADLNPHLPLVLQW